MTNDLTNEGGCLCGAIRYQITGSPLATEYCHCRQCQKAAGAPFSTWMDLNLEQFSWTKGQPIYYQSSDEVKRGFCNQCGSSLSFESSEHPEYITLTINSLDDPNSLPPERHIYVQSQVAWLVTKDDLPRFSKGPQQPA